jgi:hypothetical protein
MNLVNMGQNIKHTGGKLCVCLSSAKLSVKHIEKKNKDCTIINVAVDIK